MAGEGASNMPVQGKPFIKFLKIVGWIILEILVVVFLASFMEAAIGWRPGIFALEIIMVVLAILIIIKVKRDGGLFAKKQTKDPEGSE